MTRQLSFDLPARAALGRDDFFVSPANALAVAMIDHAETWPGGKLVLSGPPGSGKTHLAQVWAARTGARIVAARDLDDAAVPDLARGPVAVEDVPEIAGEPAAQTALFHLHNLAQAEGHRLLLTGRSAPSHWALTLPDLQSRIAAAPHVALSEPDDHAAGRGAGQALRRPPDHPQARPDSLSRHPHRPLFRRRRRHRRAAGRRRPGRNPRPVAGTGRRTAGRGAMNLRDCVIRMPQKPSEPAAMTQADFLKSPFPEPTAMPDLDVTGPGRFFNRELSWLGFNWRVLEEAENPRVPLLERLRFLSISANNLDEFYTVRVAGLRELAHAGNTTPAADGLTPAEQLVLINEDARELMTAQQRVLDRAQGRDGEGRHLGADPRRAGRGGQRRSSPTSSCNRVFPVLSPLAIDPAHPFPFIPNTGYCSGAAARTQPRQAHAAGAPADPAPDRPLRRACPGARAGSASCRWKSCCCCRSTACFPATS